MPSAKLLQIIQNEFIKLNSNSLILGIFINLRDLVLTLIPTLNFWLNLLSRKFSLLAFDKFSLIILGYFSSLYITASSFTLFHYQNNADKINSLINKSLYFITGNSSFSTSETIIIIFKIIIIGTIINLILTFFHRKHLQTKGHSSLYEDFDENNSFDEFYNRDEYNLYGKETFYSPSSEYAKIKKLSQILLYLHKIRTLDNSDLNKLLANSELMASKLGIKGLRIAELQELMLKNLENLTKDRKLDPNMRALQESLILSSKNHPEKETIFTTKLISEIIKIIPEFNQFLRISEKPPESLSNLSNHIHQFVNDRINILQNDINKSNSSKSVDKQDANGKQNTYSRVLYLCNKVTQIYNLVQEKIFGVKSQQSHSSKDFDQNFKNELDHFLNELSRTQNTIDKFVDSNKNENFSSKSKPEVDVNNDIVKIR
ncbi:hypothetical protein OAP83_00240 [Rickettsiales bacterium]|nr:hypothetical protein [Rickettsiales bacterium]